MKKNTQKKVAKPTKEVSRPRIFNIALFLFVMALMYVLLVTTYADYLRKVESLSLFIGTSSMFDNCMQTPGGLLTWASLFLTQFFYHPWLGALIYCALLGGIWILFCKAMKVPGRWQAAFAAVPLLVYMSFVTLGYLIFTLKPVGYVYTMPLGLLVGLGVFLLYRKLMSVWLRGAAIVIIVAAYPLLGFYALLTAVMCAADFAWPLKSRRNIGRLALLAITAVLVAFVPWAWFMYVGGDIIFSQIYITPLPRFYEYEFSRKIAYYSVFLLCAVAAFFSGRAATSKKPEKDTYKRPLGWLPVVGAVAVIVLSLPFVGMDKNLKLTLALDRAIWQEDYAQAIKLAEDFDGTPTRLNSVLAHIALLRTGQAGDRMFAVPYGWGDYATTRAARAMHDAGAALISYHLGLINYSYRWNTENLIGQGLSAERLKLMAKCALLNYEPELARRYIDLLYNTTYHHDWAAKYRKYLSDPMLIGTDSELSAVRMLMCNRNEFINDRGQFEGYVWPTLSNAVPGTAPFDDLSMQASLLTRDLDMFMGKLGRYAMSGKRIPRHYQEAALLWSMLNKQKCPVHVDPAIEANHDEFLRQFRNTSKGDAEGQREAMRDRFGDTYWFYYVLCDNMPLI